MCDIVRRRAVDWLRRRPVDASRASVSFRSSGHDGDACAHLAARAGDTPDFMKRLASEIVGLTRGNSDPAMVTKDDIEGFLDRLSVGGGSYKEVEPNLWVVRPGGSLDFDMVVHFSPPVVVIRVKV